MIYLIITGGIFISIFMGNFYNANIQSKKKDLYELSGNFYEAKTPGDQAKAINAMLAAKPKPAMLENSLAQGKFYSRPEQSELGWGIYDYTCIDSVNRPYSMYVPKNYNPNNKYTVLFDLHGGVSRTELWTKDELKNPDWLFMAEAKENEFIYVIPQGQKGAEWWTDVGVQNVLGILKEIKQKFNIDENKVFVTGFSDGGSGSYYMALHYSTDFAGFIPLNGHVGVAEEGNQEVYLSNLSNKPLYIVNTGQDPLYPAHELMPIIDEMTRAGVILKFKVYEQIGHSPDYSDTESPFIMQFIKNTVREPFPAKLDWEVSADSGKQVAPKDGRLHWLQINKVENVGNNDTTLTDFNPIIKTEKVIIGILLDEAYKGKGAQCKQVLDGTLAKKVAMQAGDIIVGLDTITINQLPDLRKVLNQKKPGDKIVIKILRNKKKLTLKGQFDPTEAKPAFKRGKLAGRIVLEEKENRVDVKCRNISSYTLFINDKQFDLKKEIEVYTNGALSFKGKVKPDINFMLKQAAEDMDRTMVFSNKIDVSVKAPQAKVQPAPAKPAPAKEEKKSKAPTDTKKPAKSGATSGGQTQTKEKK